MRIASVVLALLVGLQLLLGCGDDNKTTDPTKNVEHYSLSGYVYTRYATFGSFIAKNLSMIFVDQNLDSQTVVTDDNGYYSVDDLAAGPVSVHMYATDTIFSDIVEDRHLPLYVAKDTTLSITKDTTINLRIRRLEVAFADAGSNPEYWNYEYGVRNEDNKYIFWHDLRGSDMRMANNVQLPDSIVLFGFILRGVAAPSYASSMDVYVFVGDTPPPDPFDPFVTRQFTTTETYWICALLDKADESQILSNLDFRINLDYQRQTADYIYIKEIYIYYY